MRMYRACIASTAGHACVQLSASTHRPCVQLSVLIVHACNCLSSSCVRATVSTDGACAQLPRSYCSYSSSKAHVPHTATHLPKHTHTHTHTATHLPKHASYAWPSCEPGARRYFSPRFSLLCLPFYLPVYLQIAVPVHTCVPTHACVYVPI